MSLNLTIIIEALVDKGKGYEYVVQQFGPLLFVLVVPTLVLLGTTKSRAYWEFCKWIGGMVLEGLGFNYVWTWMHEHGANASVNGAGNGKRTGRMRRHGGTKTSRIESDDALDGIGE